MDPVAVRTTRDVLTAKGPDAVSYLQGQLSQEVAALVVGASAPSLLLEPNGRALAWLRITRIADDEVRLDVDAGAGEAVVARLVRFLLRSRCAITLEGGAPFLAVRGVAVAAALPSGWPLTPGGDLPGSAHLPDGVAEAGPEVLEALRIAEGVPRIGAEISGGEIPGELGGWLVNSSASFTKGCYTGQELVARVDSRGNNVPRHLRIVAGDAVVVGAELVAGEKTVGTVTSAGRADGATIGLALVHRSIRPPVTVTVGGAPVEVRAAPVD